eukprot:289860-Chlamydomonas_euryale.AAC.4
MARGHIQGAFLPEAVLRSPRAVRRLWRFAGTAVGAPRLVSPAAAAAVVASSLRRAGNRWGDKPSSHACS